MRRLCLGVSVEELAKAVHKTPWQIAEKFIDLMRDGQIKPPNGSVEDEIQYLQKTYPRPIEQRKTR